MDRQPVQSPPILVIGDVMLDVYATAAHKRPSPEGSGVVLVNSHVAVTRPGGAANVAVNVAHTGTAVRLLGVCGGPVLVTLLAQEPLIQLGLLTADAPICRKVRYQAGGATVVRLDEDPAEDDYVPFHRSLASLLAHALRESGTVVVSDYDKGTLTGDMMALIKTVRPTRVICDHKRVWYDLYAEPNAVVKMNMIEAKRLSGRSKPEDVRSTLLERIAGTLVITDGDKPVWYGTQGTGLVPRPVTRVKPISVVGAGDTAAAVLAVALSSGHPLDHAVELMVAACTAVITQPGTTPLDPDSWRSIYQR